MPPVLVAVDGGNSKTDVAVAGVGGELLGTARGGGFHPHLGGLGPAVDGLTAAIGGALDAAGAAAGDVVHLAAYLANVDLPDEEERLKGLLLARGVAPDVTVGNDTFALLRSAATEGWGVAVVCGAGINCAGVAPDGRTARFPSLGAHTGDWGGGGELGRAALWHAVRAEDGRGPHTALSAAVAAHFGVDRAIDAGLGVHRGHIAESRLTGLAPVLLDAAAAGDPVALGVAGRLAEEVALLGSVALRRLDLLEIPADVVLGGGVLAARRPVLMDAVREWYSRLAPRARLVVPGEPPLLGAALLGLDHLAAPPAAYAALRAAFHRRTPPVQARTVLDHRGAPGHGP
ncbi:N-acetylglucosamine kinase [Actinomadura xylanilytica]|uniref:N-acetylglucosamine kinase n=1 Tax=Actinomadura xylanilytica TaxID=887459 RepID=UPI00255A9A3C|nr:BadF/BadG/BcrA/BcrD ATPase family protein [Actinomadura xylanilytica]MDL4776988.1 BadF/BadG/BcrA/BcrD ATPase family protein [Actinomadura xylanilytica]